MEATYLFVVEEQESVIHTQKNIVYTLIMKLYSFVAMWKHFMVNKISQS